MWHIDVFSIHSIYILGVPNTLKTLVYMYKKFLILHNIQWASLEYRYSTETYPTNVHNI